MIKIKKIDSDLELLTQLFKWGKWKRFKWKFMKKVTKFNFIKANVECKVEAWYDDNEKEYKYLWFIKKIREGKE